MLMIHQARQRLAMRIPYRRLATLPNYKDLRYGNPLNLPRLPIPELDQTLSLYLSSIKPLVSDNKFAEHEKLVRDFQKTDGPKLHEQLVARTKKQEANGGYPYSYIEEDWDAMYLAGRYSIPINSNPGYGLIDEENSGWMDQALRAAKFVGSCVNWSRKVKSSALEPDKGPQDMSQYPLQFGGGRIARKDRDIVTLFEDSRHIVVIRGPYFYKVEVLGTDGSQISENELTASLQSIINAPKGKGPYLGVLTTQERNEWAKHRATLEADETNRASLEAIDSALAVVVLEDEKPETELEKSVMILHGNGRNRWFDKHQIIVAPDGQMGINFEHSFSDGMTWNRWIHEAWHDMHGTESGFSKLPKAPSVLKSPVKPQALTFNLPQSVLDGIEVADRRFQAEITNNQSSLLNFDSYGKNLMKTWKLSPDAVVQLSFQLAFFRAHGVLPPTYESCAVRNFLHGRTETIRSCTNDRLAGLVPSIMHVERKVNTAPFLIPPEAAAFVKSVLNNDSNDKQKATFRKAAEKHIEVAKLAQKGMGCDRHLLALSSIASKEGKVHPFFKDPIRVRSSTWRISSSNVTTPLYDFFNFGAVAEDGYGIGYLIFDDNVPINVTSFKSCEETDSEGMTESIERALMHIKKIHS